MNQETTVPTPGDILLAPLASLSPAQRNLYDRVLTAAGQDGADCADVLDAMALAADDRQAITAALTGPGVSIRPPVVDPLATALRATAELDDAADRAAVDLLLAIPAGLHRRPDIRDRYIVEIVDLDLIGARVLWASLYLAIPTIPMTGSERAMLRLACSIADDVPVHLGQALDASLDAGCRQAVVTAIATALGVTR